MRASVARDATRIVAVRLRFGLRNRVTFWCCKNPSIAPDVDGIDAFRASRAQSGDARGCFVRVDVVVLCDDDDDDDSEGDYDGDEDE